MSHPAGRKAESHARILASAGRGFRRQGFGGLGVDGLAKAAGVTSGAFYAHFKSKAAAFHEAVAAGVAELSVGVAAMRRAHGAGWLRPFVDFYLGDRLTCDLEQSCALQSLTADVARADTAARERFAAGLGDVLDAASVGGTGTVPRAEAIAMLALLTGGVSLARAVTDPELRDEIVAAVRAASERLITEDER